MSSFAGAEIRKGSARAWLLGCRPATLSVAAVPVLVGSACAVRAGGFRAGPALLALLGALFIQIGTNLANDVFDFEKGADTGERLGPTRVTQAGLLTPAQVRGGMVAAFALATLCGVYLTWVAGMAVVIIGVLSILSGMAYTGGPYPLGYHGLGDVFVMIFFGFVAVCGTAFVQLGAVPALAVAASLPVGALATAVLVVNNLRDRETDARAGKRTLAVRLGRGGALLEYGLLLSVSYAVPVALWVLGQVPVWALLPLFTLPQALALWRTVSRGEGRALNPALGGTARLLLFHGALFAAGIAL
jgi:1,4-dihydroxy-2-naphthoate octaprenyltransferase